MALFEEWGELTARTASSPHRGSYLKKVWVSPSSVKRVLAAQGLHLRHPRRTGTSARRPFPAWATYAKGSIWIYDATHFQACPTHAAVAVMGLVTRKWLSTVLSAEETSTQVQVVFLDALEAEGMLEAIEARDAQSSTLWRQPPSCRSCWRSLTTALHELGLDERKFMAMLAIAQHFGRPGTPTDQAWIEPLRPRQGRVAAPRRIADPAVLRAELDRVRNDYNTVRLHAGIGYVTPDDEHEGRGPAIRKARKDGLVAAHNASRIIARSVRTTSRRSRRMWTNHGPDLWL